MNLYFKSGIIFLMIFIFLSCSLDPDIIKCNKVYASEDMLSGSIDIMSNVDISIMEKYLEGFKQRYPKVTVNYNCLPDYENTIRQKIDENDYGDVLFMPGFIGSDKYEQYFEPFGTCEELSEQYNYMENTCRLGDIVYALPSSAYLEGIIYNKDVFYKAGIVELPKSMDEFINDLELIKERTNAVPFCTNYASEWPLFYWTAFPYFEMTGDADYKNNKFIYEKDPFLEGSNHYEAYRLLYDIVLKRLCEDDITSMDWNKACYMLANGELGCMVMGSWAMRLFRNIAKNEDSIGFMPFPNMVDGVQYITVYNDYSYAISKNCKNKKIARAYVDYMLNESGYAIDDERVSIVKTDPFPKSYGNMDNTIAMMNNSFHDKNYYYANILWSAFNPDTTLQIKRIIESAKGYSKETYDDISLDWNKRWEKARPEDMPTFTRDSISGIIIDENETQTIVEPTNLENSKKNMTLSTIERKYIAQKQEIKVGYLTDMAPFQFNTKYNNGSFIGDFEGLSAKLCKAIEAESGLKARYIPYRNNYELQLALEAEEIDMAAGLEYSQEYLDKFNFSKEYIEYSDVIIKLEDIAIDDLPYTVQAVVQGEDSKKDIILTDKYTEEKNIKGMIQSISNKTATFGITNYYSAEYYTKYGNYNHITVMPLAQRHNLRFAYPKTADARLITICNKYLYNQDNENIQLMLTEIMSPPTKNITLSRYIESNPIQCMTIIVFTFLALIISFLYFKNEKYKSARKHAVETKKFEILSQLTDEYVFVYYYESKKIHFDQKFRYKFGFDENVNLLKYTNNNPIVDILLRYSNPEENENQLRTEPFELRDISGKSQWYILTAYKIDDDSANGIHYIGKLINVQQDMEQKLSIQEKADRDALTGLYNRNGFKKSFSSLLNEWSEKSQIAVAVLDFDNFKKVNDTLGHTGGDVALKKLALTIQNLMPSKSICARYGGDEFIICLSGVSFEDSKSYFNQLVAEMDNDIIYQDINYHLSISLGAIYSNEKITYNEIFNQADAMLYEVKKNGKNGAGIADFADIKKSDASASDSKNLQKQILE